MHANQHFNTFLKIRKMTEIEIPGLPFDLCNGPIRSFKEDLENRQRHKNSMKNIMDELNAENESYAWNELMERMFEYREALNDWRSITYFDREYMEYIVSGIYEFYDSHGHLIDNYYKTHYEFCNCCNYCCSRRANVSNPVHYIGISDTSCRHFHLRNCYCGCIEVSNQLHSIKTKDLWNRNW